MSDWSVGIRWKKDPNGEHISLIPGKGISFVEIGPITAEPQHDVMPNKGAKAISNILRKKKKPESLLIAANIIKSSATDIEQASHDYDYCFTTLYDYVDMFIINVAEDGARQLQDIDLLSEIVDHLLDFRLYFNEYKPIYIQISDRLPRQDLDALIHYCRMSGVDGIACTCLRHMNYIKEKTLGRLPILSKIDFKTQEQALEIIHSGATLIEADGFFKAIRLNNKLKSIIRTNEKN